MKPCELVYWFKLSVLQNAGKVLGGGALFKTSRVRRGSVPCPPSGQLSTLVLHLSAWLAYSTYLTIDQFLQALLTGELVIQQRDALEEHQSGLN